MKQKIFVLYTGGTIGMTQSSAGLRPIPRWSGRHSRRFQTAWISIGTFVSR